MLHVPVHLLSKVVKLDLSYNNKLVLGDEGDDVNDAVSIICMPALPVLGLRKEFGKTWNRADMQVVNDVHRLCSRCCHPAIDMVCYHCETSTRPKSSCQLDQDTYFLDMIVNSCIL